MHDFDRFWEIYPRHSAKQAALKAWLKLHPGPELVEDILNAVMRQSESDQWIQLSGRYIPYPATYLNGKRWEDEEPEPAAPYVYVPWVCPHTPECKHQPACTIVSMRTPVER